MGPQPSSRQAPRYEIVRWRLLLPLIGFGIDLLLGRPRSFARDAVRVLAVNPFPRRVEGLERVPAEGAFVLTMNHYSRRGLRPYHCAMVVSAALLERRRGQPEVRWAFTSELRGQRLGPLPLPLWLIRWTFRRVARVYGLVVLPRPEEMVMGRAAALRRLLRELGQAPVGLTPEGERGTGRLVEPPPGSGLFLALLSQQGYPVLPVGVWEEGETLVVRFGCPYSVALERGLSREEQDRLAREQVMVAIGRLMPRELWGAYAAAVERSLVVDGAGPESAR